MDIHNLKPGDRVRYVGAMLKTPSIQDGDVGTVVAINWNAQSIRVRWDEFNELKHACGGACDRGHGWNVVASKIELYVEAPCEPIDVDDLI